MLFYCISCYLELDITIFTSLLIRIDEELYSSLATPLLMHLRLAQLLSSSAVFSRGHGFGHFMFDSHMTSLSYVLERNAALR